MYQKCIKLFAYFVHNLNFFSNYLSNAFIIIKMYCNCMFCFFVKMFKLSQKCFSLAFEIYIVCNCINIYIFDLNYIIFNVHIYNKTYKVYKNKNKMIIKLYRNWNNCYTIVF